MARQATVTAGRVLTPDDDLGPTAVVVDGQGRVADLVPLGEAEAARMSPAERSRVLVPGFVDLQVNGIGSFDVAAAAGDEWDELDRALLRQGVVAWCPTLVSSPRDAYPPTLERIAAAVERPGADLRPEVLGVHLEGPFLGDAPGAHPPAWVAPRDEPIDVGWLGDLGDLVRVVTVGPERPGAAASIRRLVAAGVTVAIGHTRAERAHLDAAAEAGASMVTHLFNAMSGVHHREPGVAGWALGASRLWLGLIADAVHVDPVAISLAFRAAGDRVVLVTDAVAWQAGRLGQAGITWSRGAPRLADGTLAGSGLTMDQAVRTCVEAGVPLPSAVRAASRHPALAIGRDDLGTIAPGRRADLVALGPTFAVEQVWRLGRSVLAE